MHPSEYRASANAAISEVKKNVKYRGLNTAGGWIRNPIDVPQKFAARIESMRKGAERSANSKGGGFIAETYINEMEKLAKDTNTGNCSELSAIAFNYLRSQGVRPIEYFALWRGSWNHAFVVLNRDASIPITDFAKWSEWAVACDPLYDRAEYAGYLAKWYAHALPFKSKDVIYRLE
jgi:hypothetical protein